LGGALFAAYTYYGDEILPELPDKVSGALSNVAGVSDKVAEISDKVTGMFNKESAHDKAAAAKKHGNPAGAGKSVKDVLGGPEFSDGKAPIQQVALRGGAPEPPVRALLTERMPKPDAEEADPSPMRVLPPPTPAQPSPPKPRATLALPNVSGRLSDRADLKVDMSVDLVYESNGAMREELEFKRDMLSTVAGSILRRHEYGSVNTAALESEMLTVFNGHLQAGKLIGVEIKDFQVGQVAAK